jgi:hypothetical protein
MALIVPIAAGTLSRETRKTQQARPQLSLGHGVGLRINVFPNLDIFLVSNISQGGIPDRRFKHPGRNMSISPAD